MLEIFTNSLKKDGVEYDHVEQYVYSHGGHDLAAIRRWPPRDLYDAYYHLRVKSMFGGGD